MEWRYAFSLRRYLHLRVCVQRRQARCGLNTDCAYFGWHSGTLWKLFCMAWLYFFTKICWLLKKETENASVKKQSIRLTETKIHPQLPALGFVCLRGSKAESWGWDVDFLRVLEVGCLRLSISPHTMGAHKIQDMKLNSLDQALSPSYRSKVT